MWRDFVQPQQSALMNLAAESGPLTDLDAAKEDVAAASFRMLKTQLVSDELAYMAYVTAKQQQQEQRHIFKVVWLKKEMDRGLELGTYHCCGMLGQRAHLMLFHYTCLCQLTKAVSL